jgi:hypothetical protein
MTSEGTAPQTLTAHEHPVREIFSDRFFFSSQSSVCCSYADLDAFMFELVGETRQLTHVSCGCAPIRLRSLAEDESNSTDLLGEQMLAPCVRCLPG